MSRQIDTLWFKDRVEKTGKSLRGAADVIGVDISQLSRMMRGNAGWSHESIIAGAKLFGVGLHEFMQRLGYDTSVLADAPGRTIAIAEKTGDYAPSAVPLIGTLDMEGKVTRVVENRSVAQVPGSVGALRVLAVGSPFDSCVLHFSDQVPVRECIGRTCLVETANGMCVGVVRPGTRPHRYDIANLLNVRERQEDVEVKTASPIVWMQF